MNRIDEMVNLLPPVRKENLRDPLSSSWIILQAVTLPKHGLPSLSDAAEKALADLVKAEPFLRENADLTRIANEISPSGNVIRTPQSIAEELDRIVLPYMEAVKP